MYKYQRNIIKLAFHLQAIIYIMQDNIDSQEILRILKIPPKFRLPHQHESLIKLTKDVTFFAKITSEHNSSEIHSECCAVMLLEEYEEGDFVINFGEIGEKFYILLSGSVAVMFPTKKKIKLTVNEIKKYQTLMDDSDDESSSEESSIFTDSDYENLQAPKLRREGFVVSASEILQKIKTDDKNLRFKMESKAKPGESEEAAIIKLFKDKFAKEKKDMLKIIREAENDYIEVEIDKLEEVGTLNAGDSFGELALISERPRAASVRAKEHTCLLVLRKDHFKNILGALSEKRLMSKVRFLQSLPYFFNWSKSVLVKLAYFFTQFSVKYKQCLYNEGDPTNGIYFIKDGEFKVSKKCEIKQSTNHIFSSDTHFINVKKLRLPKITRLLNVIIKGKNESVGGFEIIEKIPFREYSCVCTSTYAEVFFVHKDHFLTKFPHFESIRNLLKDSNSRLTERYQKVSENEDIRMITDSGYHSPSKKIQKLSCHDLGALSSRKTATPSLKKEPSSKSVYNAKIGSLFACPSMFMKRCRLMKTKSKYPN